MYLNIVHSSIIHPICKEYPYRDILNGAMKSTHLFIFMGTLIAILAIGGFFIIQPTLQKNKLLMPNKASQPAQSAPSLQDDAKTAANGGVSIGPADARVTVVEFLDFQCPYCQSAHPTLMQLLGDYKQKSVRFIFREFPLLSIHPQALDGANAALCANEQGKFLDFYDMAYTRQAELSPAGLATFAHDLNLNLLQFNTCFAEHRFQETIKSDVTDGLTLHVAGTPTWFINGERLEGALPSETFKEVIDKDLNK